jgi:peptidoglycan/xylan/chitin deacetylase (PgdA/CDA1 family)
LIPSSEGLPERDRLTHGWESTRLSPRLAVRAGRPSDSGRFRLALHGATAPDGGPWPAWLDPTRPRTLEVASPAPPPPTHGELLASLEDEDGVRPAVTRERDGVTFHFDPWATAERIGAERFLRPYRPLYARLPGFVRDLPGPLRLAGQHVIIPLQQWRYRDPPEPFPRFPREDGLELLRLLVQRCAGTPSEAPWPGHRPVIVLTHDVDTGEGQQVVDRIADLERRRGLVSAWYVVGDRYPVDHARLDALRAEGHEIGLHGARHDGRLAFLPPGRIARRLDRCRPMVDRHGITGFRSPALLVTDALVTALRGRFEYDSSVPDVDVRAVAGPRRGCASAFPLWRDGLLQLPLTLPLDDRLLLLGHSPEQIFETWRDKLDWVLAVGGMAMVTTHAEPHLGGSAGVLDAYARLLDHVLQQDATVLLPRQVARWWRTGALDGTGPES